MTSCLYNPFEPQNTELETYNFQLLEEIGKRLTDNKQFIPHDRVMANMDVLLVKLKNKPFDAISHAV